MKYGTFRSEIEMKDVFARFDVDIGESANWYVQGSWAQAENASDWINWVVSTVERPPQRDLRQQSVPRSGNAGVWWARTSLAPSAGWRCLPAVPRHLAADWQHASAASDHALPLGSVVHLEQRRWGARQWQPQPHVPHPRRPAVVERGNRRHR